MKKVLKNRSTTVASVIFVILSVGLASSVSLVGGLGIQHVQNNLVKIVPLLIALPALNSLVGDYATLIAAHAGDPTERTISRTKLIKAMIPSVITSTTFIIFISILLAHQRHYVFVLEFTVKYILFIILAILSVISIMFLITTLLNKVLKKSTLNPDDVLIPIVTSASDIFMLGLIALSVKFIF